MEVGRRWYGASTHSRFLLGDSPSHSLSLFIFLPPPALQIHPHVIFSTSLLLYSTLPRCGASLPFQHILWSPSVPAAFWQPAPLVTVEGGADGDVFEDVMSAEEVHSKGQIVRSHPFQFCRTQARTTFQLSEASLFWGTWGAKNLQLNIYLVKMWKKKILISLPGIVLSKMNATEPPTNMAVVRRTFNTWSISTIPVKAKISWNIGDKNFSKMSEVCIYRIFVYGSCSLYSPVTRGFCLR